MPQKTNYWDPSGRKKDLEAAYVAEPRAIRPAVDFPQIDFAIDLLSQKWTMRVVLALYLGNGRFNAICREYGVNPNTLKTRLKDLAEYGLVNRVVESELPPRVIYQLTELGKEFAEIFQHLESWASRVSELGPVTAYAAVLPEEHQRIAESSHAVVSSPEER